MFESGISNDVGDDVGDTGNACIRGAGVSNISVRTLALVAMVLKTKKKI